MSKDFGCLFGFIVLAGSLISAVYGFSYIVAYLCDVIAG